VQPALKAGSWQLSLEWKCTTSAGHAGAGAAWQLILGAEQDPEGVMRYTALQADLVNQRWSVQLVQMPGPRVAGRCTELGSAPDK
jgi:hypothetical protein